MVIFIYDHIVGKMEGLKFTRGRVMKHPKLKLLARRTSIWYLQTKNTDKHSLFNGVSRT